MLIFVYFRTSVPQTNLLSFWCILSTKPIYNKHPSVRSFIHINVIVKSKAWRRLLYLFANILATCQRQQESIHVCICIHVQSALCVLSMQMCSPELFQDTIVTICIHTHAALCVWFEYEHHITLKQKNQNKFQSTICQLLNILLCR